MSELAVKGGKPVRDKPWPRWPRMGDEEIAAATEVLAEGKMGRVVVFGQGARSRVSAFAEAWKAKYPGKDYAIPCTSCCTALELALRNAGVGPGDEVITPASTWVATNLAPAVVGADPVIVDVSPVNYCIDPDAIEAAITPRTRAIVLVHIGGYCCDMERVMAIAAKHDLIVVEDCAQAHGSKHKGRLVGTWGHFGCFSFDIAKLMTAGEGGILVCDDADLGDIVYGICGHRGEQIDRITSKPGRFVDGWNYRMTELQAAILLRQLERADEQQRKRMDNAVHLSDRLARIDGVEPVPFEPEQNFYSYMFKYDASRFKGLTKAAFSEALEAEGVRLFCSPGNQEPVYRSPFFHVPGKDFSNVRCPVAERAYSEQAIGLFGTYMLLAEKEDMDDIAEAIVKIQTNVDELLDRKADV